MLSITAGFRIKRQINIKKRTRAANIRNFIIILIIIGALILAGTFFAFHKLITTPLLFKEKSIGSRTMLTLVDVGAKPVINYSSAWIRGTTAVPEDYEYYEINEEGSVSMHFQRAVSKVLANWLFDHYKKEFIEKYERRNELIPGEYTYEVEVLTAEEAEFWGAEEGIAMYYSSGESVKLILINGKILLHIEAYGKFIDYNILSQAVKKLY